MLLPSSIITFLQQRAGHDHYWLAWFQAKNRNTGATETMGLWTGEYDREFTIDGQTRTYLGAGGLIAVESLSYSEGLVIPVTRLVLGIATEEVAALIQGYEPRNAPLSVDVAVFEPGTETLVDTASAFRGFVDKAPITRTAKGEKMYATCEIQGVSGARIGTRTLAGKKSEATLQLRDSNDEGRKYADLTATPPWGDTTDEDSFRIGGGRL